MKNTSEQPHLRVFNVRPEETPRPRVVDSRFASLGEFGQWILREALRREAAQRNRRAPHLRLINCDGQYVT